MATLPIEARHPKLRTSARSVASNSIANVIRLAVTSLVAILLPAYLTHRLPVKTYAAWVLILQLSAYVGYLDFGVQTAVSKYIAEYEAKQDTVGCNRSASVGLVIMLVAGGLGVLLTLALAWLVPNVLSTMPHSLYHDVRLSVVFVGVSLSASLVSSVFVAIFIGLQRYRVPMVITIVSRLLSGAVICVTVASHGSLVIMGAAVGCMNILTAFLQFMAWRKMAYHVRISVHSIDAPTLAKMSKYCAVLTVWSVCMLFVSGLDVTIVGHYSFHETAYYSIATSPTTFLLTITAALMGPLLPATSALSVHRSCTQMGDILLRSTRYAAIILLLTGLPMVVAGYVILRAWVGPTYAVHSIQLLRLLVVANIVRNLCAPYATMVVAMSKQRVATASALTEGIVNLVSSIFLARRAGALGVAIGTLLGAAAGVAMHFGISMRYTQSSLALPRTQLLVKGIVRPASIAVPSALLFPRWCHTGPPSIDTRLYVVWFVSTLLLAWFVGMSREDRALVLQVISKGGLDRGA
jgi:O-antigen/teichoic acid export membrane protein